MTKAERIEYVGAQLAAGKTLQQVGDALGVTRERVRQIAQPFGFRRVAAPRPPTPPKEKKPRVVRLSLFPEIRQQCKARGLPDPYRKFVSHRNGAAKRGIGFKLTFEEWWAIWAPQYHERGSRKGCKVMCRTHDTGAYEAGNVRIDTVRGNAVEQRLMQRSKSAIRWNPRSRFDRQRAIGQALPFATRARSPEEIIAKRQWEEESGVED